MSTTRYYAFISYAHEDYASAVYLKNFLEHFKVPQELVGPELRPEDSAYLRRVFLDRSSLSCKAPRNNPRQQKSLNVWEDELREKLANSRYLIVLCSPHSANKKPDQPKHYVNWEIENFLASHNGDYQLIVPAVLSGKPVLNDEISCFPPLLRRPETLSGNLPDFQPDGTSKAALAGAVENGSCMVVSRLLNLEREQVKDTLHAEKIRRWKWYGTIAAVVLLIFCGLTAWALHAERIAEQNRYLAVKNEKRAVAGECLAKENEARARANEKRAIAGEYLARENEARAKANEKRAVAGETLAKENEAKAKENEKRAIIAKQEAVEQEKIASKTLLFVQQILSEDKENKGANRSVKDVLVAQLIKIDKLEPEILKASVSDVVGLLFVQNSIFPPAEKLLIFAYNYYQKNNNTAKAGSVANNLGIYYSLTGNFPMAEKYYLESFRMLKTEDVTVLCNLADNALRNNQLEKAEKYARQAYNLSIQKHGEEAELTINAEIQIAKVLSDQGKTRELNDLLNKIEKQLIKKNLTSSWAYCRLCNLRDVYYSMRGEFDKAEKYSAFEKEYTEKKFGKKSQHTAWAYNNLGSCQYSQKKYGEAIKTLKAALEISRSVFPDGSIVEGQICHNFRLGHLSGRV